MTAGRAGRIRVLIIADVVTLAASVQSALHDAGMEADMAATADEAVALSERFRPAVVLVDFALPGRAGPALARHFAAAGCGVLAIADDVSPDDGVHDHVPRPPSMREVAARVRALHRRMVRPEVAPAGSILVDHEMRGLARYGGPPVPLDGAEYLVLTTLLEARGTAVSREWLARVAALGHGAPARVDAVVDALRRRLAGLGGRAGVIQRVRGQGYVIADPAMFRSVGER